MLKAAADFDGDAGSEEEFSARFVANEMREWTTRDRAFSGSGVMSRLNRTRGENKWRATTSSFGVLGEARRRERRQLAAILARPMSPRQSTMSSKQRVRRGVDGGITREAVVSKIVHAIRVFLAQLRAESVSRCWALARMERKRWRRPRTWLVIVAEEGEESDIRDCRNRRRMGSAWGITTA